MQAASTNIFDPKHARVLVVGPMASGKTTLVQSLCHGGTVGAAAAAVRSGPRPTIGCNVEVKLLARGYADRSIEFWDVGGNPAAALARGMFFEDSEAAGVILVYDVSNPRSLRELRAWTDELASAGIRILGSDGSVGAPAGGANIGGGSEGAAAPHRQDRRDEMGLLADLEGGSGGGAAGAVPFLMVGAKEDIGEGVRRDGARLASELGMGHVVVCAKRLANEEPFERFFGEVFRHHAGQQTLGDGGLPQWGTVGHEGQDTFFPSTTPEFSDADRARRSQPPSGWGSDESSRIPGQQPQSHGGWNRTGHGSTGDDDSLEDGASTSSGVAAARGASGGAGLVWPMHRSGAPSGTTTGAHQSRKKQS